MATGKPPWSEINDQVSVLFHIANSDEIPPFPKELSTEGKDFLTQVLKKFATFFNRALQHRNPRERPTAARILTHPFVCDVIAPIKR